VYKCFDGVKRRVVSEASAAVVKLTGGCIDNQSNNGAASVSQDFMDETPLDNDH